MVKKFNLLRIMESIPNHTKKRLAQLCGVSRTTLPRWLVPLLPELIEMGYSKTQKVFTPKQWNFIIKKLDIDN